METGNQAVTQAAKEVERIIPRLVERAALDAQGRVLLLKNVKVIEADDVARLGKGEAASVGSSLLTLPMVTDLNIIRTPPIFEYGKSLYRDAFAVIKQIAKADHGRTEGEAVSRWSRSTQMGHCHPCPLST